MTIVTMDEIFRHLRIEQGVEDDYLMSLGEVAEEMVLRYVNRTDEELRETFGGIPLGVKHACLLVVGSLYKNRESEDHKVELEHVHAGESHLVDMAVEPVHRKPAPSGAFQHHSAVGGVGPVLYAAA
ncbi:MAG: phage gp6-like head-tail connector protein, partial [Bacteroidaceae bacterium]|nr:phage gp6-like head-tail connector protein [Bacteroidaceae bacterium]